MKFWLAFFALSFSWTGSQIPLYLFGGIPPEIYSDIGGVDRWIWMVVGYLIAFAAICPFTGALSDLLGRRYVAVLGFILIIIGMIVCSTASTMNTFIGMYRMSPLTIRSQLTFLSRHDHCRWRSRDG